MQTSLAAPGLHDRRTRRSQLAPHDDFRKLIPLPNGAQRLRRLNFTPARRPSKIDASQRRQMFEDLEVSLDDDVLTIRPESKSENTAEPAGKRDHHGARPRTSAAFLSSTFLRPAIEGAPVSTRREHRYRRCGHRTGRILSVALEQAGQVPAGQDLAMHLPEQPSTAAITLPPHQSWVPVRPEALGSSW